MRAYEPCDGTGWWPGGSSSNRHGNHWGHLEDANQGTTGTTGPLPIKMPDRRALAGLVGKSVDNSTPRDEPVRCRACPRRGAVGTR